MRPSNTKNRIIEIATDLFYEHGFVKASIRDITRNVGVTNATFYIHFKRKDDILYYIIENIGSALLNELQKAVDNHEDPIECLREMIFRQVSLIKHKKKDIKIYMEEQYQLPTMLRGKALKQHRQIYELFKEKIAEIREKGLIQGLDDTVATFGIFAMMNWSYRWFRNNGKLSIEEVANQIIHIFFHGIIAKNVPKRVLSKG